MKPFNLDAAKAGAPVQTREGSKVRILTFDRKDSFPIVGLVTKVSDGIEEEHIYAWGLGGTVFDPYGLNALVMAPEKKTRTVWINVYPDFSELYETKESADECKWQDIIRLACIETTLEWEE